MMERALRNERDLTIKRTLRNERKLTLVKNTNKRSKVNADKIIKGAIKATSYILTALSAALIIWVMVSWINVSANNTKNTPGGVELAEWNAFPIILEAANDRGIIDIY